MHFLKHLVNIMFPIVDFINSGSEDVPIGYSRVITSRGGFVITYTNAYVIVKN
jgi:hypothetical protein